MRRWNRAARAAAERVRDLVLSTKHDASPSDPDARLLVDIDLSILGAARERFDEYETQIRTEYSWVPEETFRRTRAGILRQFLGRPAIFLTDRFRGELETYARENLARSLARLAA